MTVSQISVFANSRPGHMNREGLGGFEGDDDIGASRVRYHGFHVLAHAHHRGDVENEEGK